MPDDVKPDQQEGAAQPPIDMDALKAMMQDSVRDTITQMAKDNKSPEPPAAPAPAPGSDPLGDMIKPYVEPMFRSAMLEAQSASDLAAFYASNPKAAKHRDAIEEKFQALKAKGTPFTRNDIWRWHVGENFEAFAQEHAEEQKRAAEQAAREAAGVGPGSPFRGDVTPPDPYAMSPEELEKYMENKTF